MRIEHVDVDGFHAIAREAAVQHHVDAVAAAHEIGCAPALFPLRAGGIGHAQVGTHGDVVHLGHGHDRELAADCAQFEFQQVGVDQQRVGNHIVVGPRILVERRLAEVEARRLEQRAVQYHVAVDGGDALVAQRLQHVQEHIFVEVGIGAATHDQVALQHTLHDVGAAAQLGAAPEYRSQLFQRGHGREQLHGRGRLHHLLRVVRQQHGVAAQHNDAGRRLGNFG